MNFKKYKGSEFLTLLSYNINNISFFRMATIIKTKKFKDLICSQGLQFPEYVSNGFSFIESMNLILRFFDYSFAFYSNFDLYMVKLYNTLIYCIKRVQINTYSNIQVYTNLSTEKIYENSYNVFCETFPFIKSNAFSLELYKKLLQGFDIDIDHQGDIIDLNTLTTEYNGVEKENINLFLKGSTSLDNYKFSIFTIGIYNWKKLVEIEKEADKISIQSVKAEENSLQNLTNFKRVDFDKEEYDSLAELKEVISIDDIDVLNQETFCDKIDKSLDSLETLDVLNISDISDDEDFSEVSKKFNQAIEGIKNQICENKKKRQEYLKEISKLEEAIQQIDVSLNQNQKSLNKIVSGYKNFIDNMVFLNLEV